MLHDILAERKPLSAVMCLKVSAMIGCSNSRNFIGPLTRPRRLAAMRVHISSIDSLRDQPNGNSCALASSAELLVHQDARLLYWHAGRDGGLEAEGRMYRGLSKPIVIVSFL